MQAISNDCLAEMDFFLTFAVMKPITTYIFDLDGTLLDTLQDLTDSTNYALLQYGMPTRSRDEIRTFVGNGVRLLIERAVPSGTRDCDTIKVFETFRQHYLLHSLDSTQPYPGIPELLAQLKNSGKKIAIVSNKLQSGVDELHHRFFADYVDVAIGEKIGIARKPSPEMVFEALRRLGSTPEESIYIGDSEVDLQTAHNAALPCICVLWGFRDKDFLLTHGAIRFAQSPEDILSNH